LAAGGDRVVRTVEDVIDRMREIGSGLPRRDGIAEFNRVYLQVSELVRDRLRDGFFRDARFTERLGVVFAGLYSLTQLAQQHHKGNKINRPLLPPSAWSLLCV